MNKSSCSKGFTLIELAIVTLILAVLLSSAFLSVTSLRKTANIKEARQKLAEIEEALYGFAIANGRLPCPATPASNGQANPLDPSGLVGAQRNCNLSANINGFIGFVPSSTLGIKGEVNCDGLLLDPWGRPYRYSVTNADAGTAPGGDFVVSDDISEEDTAVPPNGMANVTPDIVICNNLDAACNTTVAGNVVTTNAVAVIFSMGDITANSVRENENAGERTVASGCGANYPLGNDNLYYSAPSREEPADPDTKFDDIVIWISPNTLFNKLLSAQRLP